MKTRFRAGLIALIVSIVAALVAYLLLKKRKQVQSIELETHTYVPTVSDARDVINRTVQDQNTRMLIFGQFYHETGGGTSRVFKEQLNMFGMKGATSRTNSQSGTVAGYAVYDSLEDSLDDLNLWLITMTGNGFDSLKGITADDYVLLLSSNGYFTDDPDVYLKGLKNGMEKYS